jgi:chemotaxis protein CheD
MDLLINQFVHRGITRRELVAKVFGGGKVLDILHNGSTPHVGTQNVNFVLDYLNAEKIPIISQDLGGVGGRKIYFFPWTGKVLVSRIRSTSEILVQEERYEHKLEVLPHKIVLFDQKESQ